MYSPKAPAKTKKMAKKPKKPARKTSAKKPTGQMASHRKNPTSISKKRRKRIKWGRLVILLVIAMGLGYAMAWFIRTGIPQLIRTVNADFRQITQKTTPLPYSEGAYQSLSKQLQAFLDKQKGTYGIYGIDMTTGAHFGWNDNQLFTAANESTLPVVINLYSDIANHHLNPATLVHYEPADKEAGSGFIAGMPFGTSFTVIQLAHAAIAQNDIVARNMLIRQLGSSQINNFTKAMGIMQPFAPPYVTTPKDLSIEMNYLYHMYQAHTQTVLPLIGLLEGNQNQGRIASGFAPNINVAQISANWPNEYHDAAIAMYPGHPIALSICSSGTTQAGASQVEAQAAKIVNQFLQGGGHG